PDFRANDSVRLVNGQPATADYTFLRRRGHSHQVDLNACTDVAIQIAARQLPKHGVHVDSNAPKTLTLSISDFRIKVGFTRMDSKATLEVQTSSGYAETYHGSDRAYMGGNVQNQLNADLMHAVAQMMSDP